MSRPTPDGTRAVANSVPTDSADTTPTNRAPRPQNRNESPRNTAPRADGPRNDGPRRGGLLDRPNTQNRPRNPDSRPARTPRDFADETIAAPVATETPIAGDPVAGDTDNAAFSGNAFAALGLRAELVRALVNSGYEVPTPIQAQAIPVVLSGRDCLAAAQTGTGKTAGFTLPLLQRLMETGKAAGRRPIRALIVTPTRELAAQVQESVATYGAHLPLKSTVVFGGVNIKPQMNAISSGIDILVATPGRLLDHVQQRTVDLSRVEILVLDEADRMLDMGFIRDIRRILNLLPVRRQNLLFSATFSDEIKSLADGLLNAPTRVEVARANAESELVTQAAYSVDKEDKRDFLIWLLAEEKIGQALVFTRTKHGADRLAKQLVRDGIVAAAIHGDRSQGQRTRALSDFKEGRARILVATDIAARGLDIDQLPFVINFELPNVPEDYVHRIGRTGRAGSPGTALSLVSHDEQAYLNAIEKLMRKIVARRSGSSFIPSAQPDRPSVMPPRFQTTASNPRTNNAGNGNSYGGNNARRRR